MKVEADIKVEPDELYDYITYIIAKQIENQFGDPVDPSVVKKGYTHKVLAQNAGRQNKARYTITKAVPNKLFETSYTTGERQTVTTYKIEPAPKGTHLTFISTTKNFNGKPVKEGQFFGITDWYTRRKMKRSLVKAVRKIQRSRA